jgi:hypothetical protein
MKRDGRTDTQSPTKLKACPFCGGPGHIESSALSTLSWPLWNHAPQCPLNAAKMYNNPEEALKAGNTRTPELVPGEDNYLTRGMKELSDEVDALSTRPAEPPQDVVEAAVALLRDAHGRADLFNARCRDLRAAVAKARATLTASSSGQERGDEVTRAMLDAGEKAFGLKGARQSLKKAYIAMRALASKEGSHGR